MEFESLPPKDRQRNIIIHAPVKQLFFMDTQMTQKTAQSIDWDAEADLVVVGFGGAGAATSITASEAGASVRGRKVAIRVWRRRVI
jgi:hypothetical protein